MSGQSLTETEKLKDNGEIILVRLQYDHNYLSSVLGILVGREIVPVLQVDGDPEELHKSLQWTMSTPMKTLSS